MPRLLGVDIPNDKPVYISLTYLYGVGLVRSIEICRKLSIEPRKRAYELTDDEVSQLNNTLDKEYEVEGQLRRMVQQDIPIARDSVLPGFASPSWDACSRSTYKNKCSYSQRCEENRCW